MQQREQRILKKLAEAREAQASAMSRFVQARARVMQVEARLQTLRESFTNPASASEQATEDAQQPTPSARVLEIPKPDATPATKVVVPSTGAAPAPLENATPLTNAAPNFDAPDVLSPPEKMPTHLSLPSLTPSRTETKASTLNSRETMPPSWTDEDEEDTKKVPAFRPTRSAGSTQQPVDEEETLIIALAELAHKEHSTESSETHQTEATDITSKIPTIRHEGEQTQGSL